MVFFHNWCRSSSTATNACRYNYESCFGSNISVYVLFFAKIFIFQYIGMTGILQNQTNNVMKTYLISTLCWFTNLSNDVQIYPLDVMIIHSVFHPASAYVCFCLLLFILFCLLHFVCLFGWYVEKHRLMHSQLHCCEDLSFQRCTAALTELHFAM